MARDFEQHIKKPTRKEKERIVRDNVESIRLALLGSLVEKTGWIWYLTLDVCLLNWVIDCRCIGSSLDAGIDNHDGYGFAINFQDTLWAYTKTVGFDSFIDRINYLANHVITRYQQRQIHLRDRLLAMNVETKAQESTELSSAYRDIRFGELPSE